MTDERQNLDSDLQPPVSEAPTATPADDPQAGAAKQAEGVKDGGEQSAGGDAPGAAGRSTEETAAGNDAGTTEPAADPATAEGTAAGEEAVPLPAATAAEAESAPTGEPSGEPTSGADAEEARPTGEATAAVEAASTEAQEVPDASPATDGAVPDSVQVGESAEASTEEPKAEDVKGADVKDADVKADEVKGAEVEGAEPKAEDAKAAKVEGAEPKAEDAKATEVKAEDTKTEEPKAEDAKAEDAKAEEPEDPALAALRQARDKGTPVEGRVIGWNRGGFHVVVEGLTAFCPSSEMEVGRPKSPASYVEGVFPFKVIKLQKKGRRVVLSRSAILGEQRQEVLERLAPGSVVSGRVTSLPDFGAFVDLGGVEGLVHVSEISRSRVQHPKDALAIGQEVEVKVLKVEQGGERISLSMKDLEPDPWRGANERFGRGDRFSGKVLRRADFGLFVELEPEVEGLLHVSQLPPGKSFDDDAYQPGQPIEGWVREIEPKRQRISLSLREVPTEDPWKQIAQQFPEGESVEGVVESVAPFGVFIVLAPGVTGLLPNSQTGLPRGTNAARAFAPGQAVKVQVVSIDQRRKRISLGREGTHVEASKNDLQDFKRREKERVQEAPTAMAAAFARLRGDGEDS